MFRGGKEIEAHRGDAPGGRSRREPCEEEVDVRGVPFSQQWRLGVVCGEGTVKLRAPARLGLLQLLGTLLVPQLS